MQSLHAGLQDSEVKSLLRYFTKFTLPRSGIPPATFSCPAFLLDLINHTRSFQDQWSKSPSKDLLDVNALIWNIWAAILQSWTDTAGNISPLSLKPSLSLRTLFELSDEWLTKTACEKIEAVETKSPTRVDGDSGMDQDLIGVVNTARDHLLENLNFFIELPQKHHHGR